MIEGVHALIYSRNTEAIRTFFRDILGFPSVDAGGGWLIFALPPAELALHPKEGDGDACELYLMCRDLDATVLELAARGVELAKPITTTRWGRVTTIRIAPDSAIGLYQPMHPTAIDLE